VVDIAVSLPDAVGSTAGTHKLDVYLHTVTQASKKLTIQGNTGTATIRIGDYFALVGDSESPSLESNQQSIIRGALWCNNTNTITFRYTNNLDANQTGTRTIKVLVKEFKEGS
jgi:hypothetical protein